MEDFILSLSFTFKMIIATQSQKVDFYYHYRYLSLWIQDLWEWNIDCLYQNTLSLHCFHIHLYFCLWNSEFILLLVLWFFNDTATLSKYYSNFPLLFSSFTVIKSLYSKIFIYFKLHHLQQVLTRLRHFLQLVSFTSLLLS